MLDPTNPPPCRPGVVVRPLEAFAVDWVLVGPLALAAYGVPGQEIDRVQIVPRGTSDNLERLAEALEFLHSAPLSPRPDEDLTAWTSADLWPPTSERLVRAFVTLGGVVDVVSPEEYDHVAATARSTALGDVEVLVCHPSHASEPHTARVPAGPPNVVALPFFPADLAQTF